MDFTKERKTTNRFQVTELLHTSQKLILKGPRHNWPINNASFCTDLPSIPLKDVAQDFLTLLFGVKTHDYGQS